MNVNMQAETPRELIELWRNQLKTYPETAEGQYARTAVKLCADELEAVLDRRDLDTDNNPIKTNK